MFGEGAHLCRLTDRVGRRDFTSSRAQRARVGAWDVRQRGALKASATEHTLSPSWEQGLWEALYMTLRYDHTWGSSQQGDYTVQSIFAGIGYRL